MSTTYIPQCSNNLYSYSFSQGFSNTAKSCFASEKVHLSSKPTLEDASKKAQVKSLLKKIKPSNGTEGEICDSESWKAPLRASLKCVLQKEPISPAKKEHNASLPSKDLPLSKYYQNLDAEKLRDCIMQHPTFLLNGENLKQEVLENTGLENFPAHFKEVVLKKAFAALKELNHQKWQLGWFEKTTPGPYTRALLGNSLFQYRRGRQAGFLSVQLKFQEGGHNTIFLALDLSKFKWRVFRTLTHVTPIEIAALRKENKLHEKLQKIPQLESTIVKTMAVFEKPPYYGSVLQYADQGSLYDAIIERRIGLEEKKRISEQITSFLQNFHANGFVYGDLKSENVFLKTGKNAQMEVKVGDFGGAYQISDVSPHMTSPTIVAPESFGTLTTNQATDCWSLGILLYEMKYSQGGDSPNDVPPFVEDVLTILNCFKPTQRVTRADVLKAQTIARNALANPTFLDTNDPYDQLILGLLEYDPKKRMDMKTACEKLKAIPKECFSLKPTD